VDGGVVRVTPNLPLTGVALEAPLRARLGMDVRLENDANCALLGEKAFGAAVSLSNVVMFTVGTGLGSAVLLGGKLFFPSGGPEIGHMVLYQNGEPCGCAERYVSATALVRLAHQGVAIHPDSLLANERDPNGKTIFAAAKQGDTAALAALARYFDDFAEVLMNCVVVFRPQAIIIGGGLSGAGEAFFTPLRERLFDRARMGRFSADAMPQVLTAQRGNDAGILGAASLFNDQIISWGE
jgi:glucokinase